MIKRSEPGGFFFPGKSQSFIWHFLFFLIPASIALIIGIALHYTLHIKANLKNLETTDLLNVRLAQITVNNVLRDIVSDIKYLQEHNEASNGFINTPRARKILEEDFLSFSKNRKIYDQIRYLNLNGKEIVRVNYNNGHPVVVNKEQLQTKDNRYYVANTIDLKRNEIYWSPFDLNVENNQIESPYKPTIRVGIPVYSSSKQRTGVLILNFDGKKLLTEFKRATANIANHIMLVNAQGYWLMHPQGKNEWAFMFSRNNTFAIEYPELWQEIKNNNHLTQKHLDDSLLTYATIHVNNTKNPGTQQQQIIWKIIAYAPATLLHQSHVEFISRNALFYELIFLVIVVGSFLLARVHVANLKAEAQSEYDRSFRNILESMDFIALTLDQSGRIIFCNQSFIKLSGYLKEDILNTKWFDHFVDKAERDSREKQFKNSFNSPSGSGEGKGEIIIKNGQKRLIGWRSTLSYDSENNPVSITFIGTDITEQQYIENELRKASQAVEQSPNTVMITDISGHIVYTNPKFTELTGYSKEEVLGKNPKILQSGETSKDEYKDLWEALKAGREWVGEFHNKKKNGEFYWESARISAIKDKEGKITHFLAVKEDVTEKKQLAEEVELRNMEIAKNQLLAGIGKMATMIAHDLRNPLSSIKMGMQILQHQTDKPVGKEGKELIHISLEQVQYMEAILSDLLSFSRPDQLTLEWLSIEKLLDTALLSLQKQIEDYKVRINTDYQTGLPTIYGDKTKLRQVFSNLLTNALQALEQQHQDDAVISISAFVTITEMGPMLEIQIKDNGSGINDETREKLFEPFFTTRARGTGLGLAIVKRIIEQHKGRIIINSEFQEGTNVIIILPTSPIEIQTAV